MENGMRKAGLWTIIAGALLLFLPGIGDPYMTPRLLLPALGAIVLLLMPSGRRSALELPALAMLGAAGVAGCAAQDRGYALVGAYQFPADSVLAIACYVAVLIAAARANMELDELIRMVAWVSLPMSAYAIAQRFVTDPLLYGPLPAGRVVSTQGGPIWLGAVLAIVALCALYLARRGDRLGLVALALALPAAWFTQTRGAFVAMAVGGVFLMRGAPLLLLPGLLALPRLFATRSDTARLEVWETAWRIFLEHPWLGYGPGNFQLAFRRYVSWDFVEIMGNATAVQSHAHSDLLHALATMGVLGGAAYLLLGAAMLRTAWKHPARQLLLALLAAYVVVSSFNPVAPAVYLVLALVFGVASIEPAFESRRWAPAIACLGIAAVSVQITVASWHFARGAAARQAKDRYGAAVEFNRAAQLNPWEAIYTVMQLKTLHELIPIAAAGQAQQMAIAGLKLAGAALARHPMDSYAHEHFGNAVLVAYVNGLKVDPREALQRFNRAQELAPTFEVLMWRRRKAAQALGDDGQVGRADVDINNLRVALAGGGRRGS